MADCVVRFIFKPLAAGTTGALAGGSVGLATLNPTVAGYTAAAFGGAAMFAHAIGDNKEENKGTVANQISRGIMVAEDVAVSAVRTGVGSLPWAARFAITDTTLLIVLDAAQEWGLDETGTTALAGCAIGAGMVVAAMPIAGTAGVLNIMTGAWKEMINFPGAWAGTPLRTPDAPLTNQGTLVMGEFDSPTLVNFVSRIAANPVEPRHGSQPFTAALAQSWGSSALTASGLIGASVNFGATYLHYKSGGGSKPMPRMSWPEFCDFAKGEMRGKMVAGAHMVTGHALEHVKDLGLPEGSSRCLIAPHELLKFLTSGAGLFSLYGVANHYFATHRLETLEEMKGLPTQALAAGSLYGLAWFTELVGWTTYTTKDASNAIDRAQPSLRYDLQVAATSVLEAGLSALIAEQALNEFATNRSSAGGQGAAIPYALLIGVVSQVVARMASAGRAERTAWNALASTITGVTTGAFQGGPLAAAAAAGGTAAGQLLVTDRCIALLAKTLDRAASAGDIEMGDNKGGPAAVPVAAATGPAVTTTTSGIPTFVPVPDLNVPAAAQAYFDEKDRGLPTPGTTGTITTATLPPTTTTTTTPAGGHGSTSSLSSNSVQVPATTPMPREAERVRNETTQLLWRNSASLQSSSSDDDDGLGTDGSDA